MAADRLHSYIHSAMIRLSALLFITACTACVTVRPWEREELARPAMLAGLGEEGMAGEYRAKTLESTTAAGLPGDAPGGGCGCTQ